MTRFSQGHEQDVSGEAALFESAGMEAGLENYTEADYELLWRAAGLLPATPGTVFEAGCGSGAFGRRLARHGYKVEGVDISRTLVAVANREAKKEKVPYKAMLGDLNKVPAKGRHDIVLCPMVLHHFVDLDAIMPQLVARLKPGGVVVAMEPNGSHPAIKISEFFRRRLPFIARRADIASPNETNHRRSDYAAAFIKAGLTVESMTAVRTQQVMGDYGVVANLLLRAKKLAMDLGWLLLPHRFGGNTLVAVARRGPAAIAAPARTLLVAGHCSETYGPVQALVGSLDAQGAAFSFISLPFLYSGLQSASLESHAGGKVLSRAAGHAKRGPDPWLWVKDFLFVLGQGWRLGRSRPVDLCIGVDGLNAAAGVLLKRLGRARQVAYYVIDYTDRRFSNPLLNWAYHAVDRYAVRGSDVVWNLSTRMQAVRRAQGLPEPRNQVVPVGVDLDQVRLPKAGRQKRHALLYMGSLHANKGIQLIVDAMPALLKKAPKAELHIFGAGPYEAELSRLVAASPAKRRIHLRGSLDHAQLFAEAPRYGVAFAPYLEEPHSYSYWCDPTKPKEYLACGLPVIITKVPWIWELIGDPRRPMGAAIAYDPQALLKACERLLSDGAHWRACRRNALAYAAGLAWDSIYAQAFAGLPSA